MLNFHSRKVIAIGEAMVELAVVGDNRYQRSFAGDTYNTAWHLAQIRPDETEVGFVTCVGTDSLSDTFLEQLLADGIDPSAIRRTSDRNMGLYLIELDGVERSFHYWRNASAAKLLADDVAWLDRALDGAGLIHVSGITLAILSSVSRKRLQAALIKARGKGALVSFDPNIRPRLWKNADEIRRTVADFLEVTDIALPSFDDEQLLWGDMSPEDTIARIKAAGVQEIIVKNGAGRVCGFAQSESFSVATPSVTEIRDTSGAGDAFNAGYLAVRLDGQQPSLAIAAGQKCAAEVIKHFGARIPKEHVPTLR
jgi:2-dehydro-3-deoxygluconokinase